MAFNRNSYLNLILSNLHKFEHKNGVEEATNLSFEFIDI